MTQQQEKIIDKIEALIMQLSLSDKTDKAKGEIEDIKTAIRHTIAALNN